MKPDRPKCKAWQAQRKPIMPDASPNASRWNMGCVSLVDFMLFASISFALGTQRKRNFWWNMVFTQHLLQLKSPKFSVLEY